MYSAKGIGSPVTPVPPPILSKIYTSVALPKLLYGLDVCPIEDNAVVMLENAHRQFARFVQYLPQNTPTPSSLATLGWMSITPQIALLKIMFILRTLCLPVHNIFAETLRFRLTDLICNDNFSRDVFCWTSSFCYTMFLQI